MGEGGSDVYLIIICGLSFQNTIFICVLQGGSSLYRRSGAEWPPSSSTFFSCSRWSSAFLCSPSTISTSCNTFFPLLISFDGRHGMMWFHGGGIQWCTWAQKVFTRLFSAPPCAQCCASRKRCCGWSTQIALSKINRIHKICDYEIYDY